MSKQGMDPELREFLIQNGWDEAGSSESLKAEDLNDFIEFLVLNGWRIEKKQTPLALSDEIRSRYANLPPDYEAFLTRVSSMGSPRESIWFWCEPEFNIISETCVWNWNYYEEMENDWLFDEDKVSGGAVIKEFWDWHIPLANSVVGDYAYLAISLRPDDYGCVVYDYSGGGEVQQVCGSFSELAGLLRWAITRGIQEENPSQIYDFVLDPDPEAKNVLKGFGVESL
jgi:hypothetical protein